MVLLNHHLDFGADLRLRENKSEFPVSTPQECIGLSLRKTG